MHNKWSMDNASIPFLRNTPTTVQYMDVCGNNVHGLREVEERVLRAVH
jgi:hypothetical protein